MFTGRIRSLKSCNFCAEKSRWNRYAQPTTVRGWIVDQELEVGLRSLSVPIRDGRGKTVAALNLCCPSARITAGSNRAASGLFPRRRPDGGDGGGEGWAGAARREKRPQVTAVGGRAARGALDAALVGATVEARLVASRAHEALGAACPTLDRRLCLADRRKLARASHEPHQAERRQQPSHRADAHAFLDWLKSSAVQQNLAQYGLDPAQ